MDYPLLDTRGADWTVFRPSARSFGNLAAAGYVALVGAGFLTWGAVNLAHGHVGGLGQCVFGLALLALQHGLIWSYYVAVNERHIAAGRIRSRGIDIVERADVAGVVWRGGQKVERGVLCSADGTELLALGQWLGKQRVAELAQALDVPFTVTGRQPKARG